MSDGMKESLIIELSSSSGYNPEIVELLYDFTGGDKDRIQKILSSLNTNILIVKANADSKPIDKKAFFYLAYDMGRSEILEKGFFAYNRLEPLNLKADWDDLRKAIFNLKSENKFDGKMWTFFEREIQQPLFIRELKKLTAEFLHAPKFQNLLETLLGKTLGPVFYNKNFSMDLEYFLLDPLRFYQPLEKKEEKPDEQETEDKKKEESIIRLKVYPHLDPISGKSVRDIKPEDEVLFELRDEREAAHYITELLEEKNSDRLVGRLKGFSIVDQDTVKLEIFFAPGIYGESIIPRTLLLKTAPREAVNPKKDLTAGIKTFSTSYKSFLIGIIVVMFITILLLLFY